MFLVFIYNLSFLYFSFRLNTHLMVVKFPVSKPFSVRKISEHASEVSGRLWAVDHLKISTKNTKVFIP